MSTTKPIGRVAIIGTGVIGASWTALFLAKGLRFFADRAAKKWPRRGSLKLG